MARMKGDGDAPRSGQDPHWEELTALIDELAKARDHLKGDGAISYRQLSVAIGRSPTILYGIVDRYHMPTAGTLCDLADYAAKPLTKGERFYPPLGRLADRALWLWAGGLLKGKDPYDGTKLSPIEEKAVGLLRALDEVSRERMVAMMEVAQRY